MDKRLKRHLACCIILLVVIVLNTLKVQLDFMSLISIKHIDRIMIGFNIIAGIACTMILLEDD